MLPAGVAALHIIAIGHAGGCCILAVAAGKVVFQAEIAGNLDPVVLGRLDVDLAEIEISVNGLVTGPNWL